MNVSARRHWSAGIALGLYACAIAFAPSFGAKALLCLPLVVIPLLWWLFAGLSHWVPAFFLAAWLLPPLPVALGNSGPHISLLFAAIGGWIGVAYLPRWRFRLDGAGLSILLVFASLCLSLPLALFYSGPAIAALSAVRVLLFGISIYVYFYVRSGADLPRIVPVLFWAAVGSAAFACLDFYFQFPAPAGYGPQFVWLASGVYRRAQGLFYEASTLGNLCAFFLVLIVVCVFTPRSARPLRLWALLGGGAALACAMLLSYSRGSLVNVCVACAALVALERRIRFLRVLPAIALLAVACGIILFFAVPEFAQAYWNRALSSAQYLFESPNAVLSGRVRTWETLLDFLSSHPWHALLGVGYKTLPYSDFIGAPAIADNTYLSALLETGVLGLAALLFMNVAILRAAYRAAKAGRLLGTWIFCFWCGETVQMFSGDLLTYWRVLPAYFCILALAENDANPIRRSV